MMVTSPSRSASVMDEKHDLQLVEHAEELALAEQAEQTEHTETVWSIIKRNPLILLIVAYANLGSFMFGFDNLALSIALSMPSFGYERAPEMPWQRLTKPAA